MKNSIPGGKVERVLEVSDWLRDECYCIANTSDDAVSISSNLQKDVKNGDVLLVYKENNYVCGFIKGFIAPVPEYADFPKDLKAAKIHWFYVDKKYGRQGIGEILLKAYSEYMVSNGIEALHLYSRSALSARSFYNKHGFKLIGWNLLMGKVL